MSGASIRFEHFAMNVAEPVAMADWYCANLGMSARVAKRDGSPYVHFLADATGRVILEIYHNPACAVPDYAGEDALRFHFAFAVDDVDTRRQRLIEAGARVDKDETLPDGSRVLTLRDPWGVPFQLCRRTQPFD